MLDKIRTARQKKNLGLNFTAWESIGDTEIIIDQNAHGVLHYSETALADNLFLLCGDDAELEFTFMDFVKAKLIDGGVISQSDIDAESIKPEVVDKLDVFRTDILTDNIKKVRMNEIRKNKGLAEL